MEKVSLDISREEELSETVRSFPALYGKSQKGFKEKDGVKMHEMESQRRWNLFKPVNTFTLALLFLFLKLSYSFRSTH